MQHLIAAHGYICRVRARDQPQLSLRPVDAEHAIRVQNGDDVTQAATSVMEPDRQLMLTLKLELTLEKEEQSASKGDIAGLSAQLKAMQASPEPLAASR
jgi:hypothetical protein